MVYIMLFSYKKTYEFVVWKMFESFMTWNAKHFMAYVNVFQSFLVGISADFCTAGTRNIQNIVKPMVMKNNSNQAFQTHIGSGHKTIHGSWFQNHHHTAKLFQFYYFSFYIKLQELFIEICQ